MNWGNVLGDAGLVLGVSGMFACLVCGALGVAGAVFSVGGGAWNLSPGNVGDGMWGLAGGVPIIGAAGCVLQQVLEVQRLRGSGGPASLPTTELSEKGLRCISGTIKTWISLKRASPRLLIM